MVEFGKQLAQSRHEPWAGAYLDYKSLKKALKQLANKTNNEPADALSIAVESTDFEQLVDREIEKVVLFFLEKQGDLAKRLNVLRNKNCSSAQEQQYDEYHQIGEELVLLVNFCELNVTGLRKILKKHDKKSKAAPITERYLNSHMLGHVGDSHLQQMYHYGGIAALVETLRLGLEDDMTRTQQQQQQGSVTNYSTLSSIQEMQPILHKIDSARQRLKHSSRYAQAMAAQALIFEDEGSDTDYSLHGASVRSQRDQRISAMINLASTFLYMTNYYIVAPTSGTYAKRLGMSEALSGVIIGMTPCAALVASVLYSWWSNYTYKRALLFAATCSIVGDLLYALALPCNSLSLVIVGRLLNGFGGARAINRRYIADAVSRRHRTAASAAFVTAGALGMAAGPALAVAADYWTPQGSSLLLASSGHWWTVETAPGWIMFVLWTVFWVSAYLFFEEPAVRASKQKVTSSGDEEQQPLIAANGDKPLLLTNGESSSKQPLEAPLYKNVAVMTTLGIYFVLKLALECQLSSTAIVTTLYFDWNVTNIGSFLAVLGLLMFPANMAVAHASRRYEDREIMLATLSIIFVGTLGIMTFYPWHYTVVQYMVFSVCLFLGTNMLEGPNMSLLSKTIPKQWARGTFNSGLLATESGTFGRVVGDFIISAAGLVGLDQVLNLTFAPMAGLVGVTMLVTWKLFSYLVPYDDDDDDDDFDE